MLYQHHVRDPRKSRRANNVRKRHPREVANVFPPETILEVIQKTPAVREQIYHRMSLLQGISVATDLRQQVEAAERTLRGKR